jgi:hypothetical protein
LKLYNARDKIYKPSVLKGNAVVLAIVVLVGIGLGLAFTSYFSEEARMRRRRRKSHSKIISKTRRPIVRFSVRPPKKK